MRRLVRGLKRRGDDRPAGRAQGGDEGADPSGPRNPPEHGGNPSHRSARASAAGRWCVPSSRRTSRAARVVTMIMSAIRTNTIQVPPGRVTEAHTTCYGWRERPPRRVARAQVFDPQPCNSLGSAAGGGPLHRHAAALHQRAVDWNRFDGRAECDADVRVGDRAGHAFHGHRDGLVDSPARVPLALGDDQPHPTAPSPSPWDPCSPRRRCEWRMCHGAASRSSGTSYTPPFAVPTKRLEIEFVPTTVSGEPDSTTPSAVATSTKPTSERNSHTTRRLFRRTRVLSRNWGEHN